MKINMDYKKYCDLKRKASLFRWSRPGAKERMSKQMKGKFIGRIMTKEARKKMSLARKGLYFGKNNPAWKGGIVMKDKLERNKFRKTLQKKVFERDEYTCQLCGEHGGKLQVDHIQSWANYVELRFNIENCRTLCMSCHYKITFGKPLPKHKVWGHNFKLYVEKENIL